MTAPEPDWAAPADEAVLAAVGAAIRELREHADLTQAQLGEMVGVTQTAVSYWEAGKRGPGIPELLRLACALGVTGSDLLPIDKPAEPPLPDGRYARVELPGYRQHTGWITEETRFGQAMAVIRDWDGAEMAAVAIGPASQVVYLPTPLRRPEPAPARALPPGRPGALLDHLSEALDEDDADLYEDGAPF